MRAQLASAIGALVLVGCELPRGAAEAPLTLGPVAVAPIGGGNALTLPAQRHLVRVGASDYLALQQDGAGAGGLGFFRSDDADASWRYAAALQGDASHRDTADLLVDGSDVLVVYSYEGPILTGSARHDVYFQRWHTGGGALTADPALRVFDSTSDATAYYRAELARDSLGRIFVQAFFLQANGSSSAVVAVSTDGGKSFAAEPPLVTLGARGGGRLISLGTRLLFVFDEHDGTSPARFRVRDDAASVDIWGPIQLAFPEGIYHGAALSAVADGRGGLHLFYVDKSSVLRYRRFDGSAFGAASTVETEGNWELQSAATRVGDDVVVFYNRVLATNVNDEVFVRRLRSGVLSAPELVDGSVSFKGYPAAVESLPASVANVPCVFGVTPNASSGGTAELYRLVWSASPPDLGAPPDLAPPVDLLPPPRDASPPPDAASTGPLFADDFNRAIAPNGGLGNGWSIVAGAWWTNGHANTDVDGANLAAAPIVCADCRVEARVLGFGVPETALTLRGQASGDRYDFVLLASGAVRVRKIRAGAITVLGESPSGVALDGWATLSLRAEGAAPVVLAGAVNGVEVVRVSDAQNPIGAAGAPGLWSTNAGVWFGAFAVWPPSATPPPPPPPPSSFSDDFNRVIAPNGGLGPSWIIDEGFWYTNRRAISDLDGRNRASAIVRCADCSVAADVTGFGVPESGVFARESAAGDRYELILLGSGSGNVRLRRVRGAAVTTLGETASGLGALDVPARLALSARGSGPVALTAAVNGVVKLSVSDGVGALTSAGAAGLWTSNAGVWFGNFSVAP